MKPTRYFLTHSFIALTLLTAACSGTQPANSNRANGNATANANAAQPKPANSNSTQPTRQANTGTIEVTSIPQGAGVTLVPDYGDSAGTPRSYGLTPATITDLAPGKYLVTAKTNDGFAQKEVEVAANKTVKISLTIKKQAAGARR